ncbi:MAG: hypothetical protein ABR499_20560 [Gemmatimonadaceae bacterium]
MVRGAPGGAALHGVKPMLTPELPIPSSRSTPSLTTSEGLVLAVVRAARAARAPTAELRDAVCAYVRDLKARGYPPERVLVAVKTLAADAGLRRTAWADRDSKSVHQSPEDEIMDRVVAWCIEEFFRAPPRAD